MKPLSYLLPSGHSDQTYHANANLVKGTRMHTDPKVLCTSVMNSMKLVIPLLSLYWSIHTKDESKRGTAFAFIFGVVVSQHRLESFS